MESMEIGKFLSPRRVIFLESRNKADAIREIVETTCRTVAGLDTEAVYDAVWERESTVSSWIAPGIAIPHGRLNGLKGFIVAVGRSREGIVYESGDGQPVYLLFLILGNADEVNQHIMLLAEIARMMKTETVYARIMSAENEREIYDIIKAKVPSKAKQERKLLDLSRCMLERAVSMAEDVGAKALITHIGVEGAVDLLKMMKVEIELILVTYQRDLYIDGIVNSENLIHLPYLGLNRTNHITLTLLIALTRGLIERHDLVVILYGPPGSGSWDTLMVIDVANEIPTYLPYHPSGLLGDVEPQVLERILQLATTLSREGREGKAVGTVFVLGDYGNVKAMSRQMVINPFKGYLDEEKSILDPSLEETIKEFATIDGAFLIRGDGVIQSAGTYLRPSSEAPDLPSGLGSRHAAAASITAFTNAFSVVISQSTGAVSLFRGGRLIMNLEKSKS
jgi:DNA integrity scanning protein DisA with diadenylate cyclase activity/mannitol/fructose-specific phosphotransferase system IIA component (Ntr-type)